MIEEGEAIRVPADWATRGDFLATEFACFERHDLRYYRHVNGLFVVFLSRTHPLHDHPLRHTARCVFTEHATKILKVTGKKRKGAPRVDVKSQFAHIVLEDGTQFPVQAGIKGFVIEINETLTAARLLDPECPEGYLALLQPKSDFESHASFVPKVLEEARARRALKQQKKSGEHNE